MPISYVADRYAEILTKEDIEELFGKLTERLQGNRSEAARQCGLTGKATYDWEKAGYVKLGTKRKVLEACLKVDFLNTVEYLLSRYSERTVDILRTILSTIYMEAVDAHFKDQFCTLLDRFDTLRMKYRGLIRDHIADEIADMLWLLRQRASELEVPTPPKSIEDMSARELLDVLPLIGEEYLDNPRGVHIIAKTLDLPPGLIETLWPTFEKLHPIGGTITGAEPAWIQAGEIDIRMGIRAPALERAQPDELMEMRVSREMVSAPRVATSSETYVIVVSVQSEASPSVSQRYMTARPIMR